MLYKTIDNTKLFDDFVEKHPYGHFQKTSMWGKFKQKTKKNKYKLLGFFDENNTLIATAMVLFCKTPFGTYLYIPKGPCVNYQDQKLTIQVLTLLKEYARLVRAVSLIIDPNVLHIERDIQGNIIEGGINNEFITNYISQNGFKHRGYNYAYDGSLSNRYTLITKLYPSLDENFKKFATDVRHNINKAKRIGIYTEESSDQTINDLVRLEADLGKYKTVIKTKNDFYQQLYDCFKGHVHCYRTVLPIANYLSLLHAQKDNLPVEKQAKINTNIQRIEELQKQKGDQPVIAAGLFIKVGDTTYTNYYFRDHDFNFLSPVSHMIYKGMEIALEEKCKKIDYLGFGGLTTPHDWDPGYPLYEFKHRWNSTFIEDIGQFEFTLKPLNRKLINLYQKLLRKYQLFFTKHKQKSAK